jgi:hypothetical protein
MQKKQRKLSSQRARLLRRLHEAELDFEQRLQAAEDLRFFPEELREAMLQYDLESAGHSTAFVRVTARDELLAERQRPLLLAELANLQESGIAQFQKSLQSRKGFRPLRRFFTISDAALLTIRDELLTIWKAETPEIRSEKAHEAMVRWLRWEPLKEEVYESWRVQQYSPFFPSLEFGSIRLDTRNFHAQMTQAVLERIENMRVCGNPDCANPYFLARRSDQKYCEEGSCTIYGHRQSALEYWHRTHNSGEESDKQSTKTKKGKKNGRSDSRKTKR